MSKIQDTLVDLGRAPGVKGSALVTPDGLMVAQRLDPRFREDVIAGLTSFLVMTTSRCLQESGMDNFEQFVLQATHGKVVFLELDGPLLVVVLDQFADLTACRQEILAAAQELRRCARIA